MVENISLFELKSLRAKYLLYLLIIRTLDSQFVFGTTTCRRDIVYKCLTNTVLCLRMIFDRILTLFIDCKFNMEILVRIL